MEDLKLSEIKEICLKHQKQNCDCESCKIYRFCLDNFTCNYPSGWELEDEKENTK